MKLFHRPMRTLAGLCALITALSVGLSACSSGQDAGADTGEAVTRAPVTLPDLTDDREPTDTADYAFRVEAAFADATPVPASDLTYTVGEQGVTVTGYSGGEVVVVIPDTIEDRPVVAIAEGAFADRSTLRALSLPDSVEVIGIGALEGCDHLATLQTPVFTCTAAPYFGALFGATTYEINAARVPDSLTTLIVTKGETVPAYAFYDCHELEVVALPATVTEIGDFAFYGCKTLRYMPLEHTALTSIGQMALANCAALLSLSVPATAETLGEGMLEGCGALESLTLPFVGANRAGIVTVTENRDSVDNAVPDNSVPDETVTVKADYLGYLFGASDYTFTAGYLPASLMTVTLLAGCGDIPANAFFECAFLREVILPDGVTKIGHRAFYGCERLASVTLPDTVTTVGDDAFHGCIRLATVELGAGLTTLGVQAFMDCMSLSAVTLPDGVTHLPNACFAGCVSLVTLTAPGVKSVGKQVFRHCDRLTGWEDTVTAAE